ncbi:MAG TPA: hypothetical protein DCS07_05385 [Bdellovibrionales bacterium]|nr:MAG: hypothetical protein A2Z97_09050 [Bdellovibrionales bacterium GWB1_52_6]OFZ06302.1 MAG: hypothetical protein A2X97_02450 [Bdellovibrionales bacterium GWA1_52_35]OFZ36144.1 MAG: hypothetical protein A2070_04460 [Bdellovibrionales bacterium GWC1_52_8]HAR42051.1 hypothetical protein [Bdellovibrionales bacterium]HCM40051.1 hypothetical protein [Bdellovibrionales bacterium]
MMRLMILAAMTASVLIGCGEGKDPIAMIANGGSTPTLSFPFTPAGLTANRDGFLLTAPVNGVLASPVTGVVTLIEAVSNSYAITIYYNSTYSVRMSQLNMIPQVRVGEAVQAGQLLGTVVNNPQILFSLFQNGASVCAYSYLDAAARVWVHSGTNIPCPTN